ncbi:transcription factor WhiB [Streptomyces collinus]|uniref:transcription factor WhiB n=1 Tax=Streptomyces collinus TaxID=42684 RepID=UPI0037BB1E51
MSGWIGGLQISRTDRGQTPVADFLCAACGTYRRITGRDKVRDFVKANPMAEHRAKCRPPKTT